MRKSLIETAAHGYLLPFCVKLNRYANKPLSLKSATKKRRVRVNNSKQIFGHELIAILHCLPNYQKAR